MGIITREQDYILRVLKALNEGTGWLNAEDISGLEGVPKSEVFKMVRILKGKDLIDSKSGQGGGYKLKANLKEIKVLECIRLLDLDVALVRDVQEDYSSKNIKSKVGVNLDNLQIELQQRMLMISVHDLIYTNIQETKIEREKEQQRQKEQRMREEITQEIMEKFGIKEAI